MRKTMMEEALRSFLEERKDEIIDKAANMLADRFQRTKKYREAMGAVIAKDGKEPGNHRRNNLHDDYFHRIHRITVKPARDSNRQDR